MSSLSAKKLSYTFAHNGSSRGNEGVVGMDRVDYSKTFIFDLLARRCGLDRLCSCSLVSSLDQ